MRTDPGAITVEAMLCRYAEVNDGGLTIIGAGANRLAIGPEPPYRIGLWLGLLVHIPYTRTNENHLLSVELVYDTPTEEGPTKRVPINLRDQSTMPNDKQGKFYTSINVGRPPMMRHGEETLVPFAIPVQGKEVPGPGHFFFRVCIGTEPEAPAQVPFDVEVVRMVGLLG